MKLWLSFLFCLLLLISAVLLTYTPSVSSFAVNNYYVSSSGSGSTCSVGSPGSFASCDGSGTVTLSGTPGRCTSADGLTWEDGVGACIHVAAGNYTGPITTNKSGTILGRVMWVCDTKWACKINTINWFNNGQDVTMAGFDGTSPANGANNCFSTHADRTHIFGNNCHDFDLTGCAEFGIVNVGNGDGVHLYHDIWVIGNVLRHISNYTAPRTFGGGANNQNCITAHGIYDFGSRTVIMNNILSAITGPALLITQQIEATNIADQPKVISNNTIFNSGGGINLTGSTTAPIDYFTISNNIIVNNGVDMDAAHCPSCVGRRPIGGDAGIAWYHVTGSHNLATNNLMYGNNPDSQHHFGNICGTNATGSTPSTGTPISGNDTDATGGCPDDAAQTDNPSNDPTKTFVNFQPDMPTAPAANFNYLNYAIKSSSHASGNGSTSCTVSPGITPCTPPRDILANARTGALDIGAFSLNGITPPGNYLPSSVSFGSVNTGTTTGQDVTYTNVGGSSVTVSSISFTGADAAEFSQTSTNSCGAPPFPVASGVSCTIHVGFTPVAVVTYNATLQVVDSGGTRTASMTGTGQTPQVPSAPTGLTVVVH